MSASACISGALRSSAGVADGLVRLVIKVCVPHRVCRAAVTAQTSRGRGRTSCPSHVPFALQCDAWKASCIDGTPKMLCWSQQQERAAVSSGVRIVKCFCKTRRRAAVVWCVFQYGNQRVHAEDSLKRPRVILSPVSFALECGAWKAHPMDGTPTGAMP